MWVKGVVFVPDPGSKFFEKHKRARPFAKPDELSFMVRLTRSESALPLGLLELVKA
jgi:hypothetical protein